MNIDVGVECPECKGTGWIYSTEIPGLRRRCKTCNGTGQKDDHREYLAYKREVMEMDEASAAREAAKEDD